jgi:hypothetical protein
MGTDDLFHKRKARSRKELQRRAARRDPYAKILIVCEGEKTEPLYFTDARNYYSLNTANIEVCGDCDSDPISILRYAKQRYREEKDAGDAFDRVYCVFDRDAHHHYDRALREIAAQKPHNCFFAITSVPCFEYWLLLHYVYSTRPYVGLPGSSSGNQMVAELRRYFPEYQKGRGSVFTERIGELDFAINNSKRSLQASEAAHTDNPTTRVHELVEFMRDIKK